VWESNPVIEEFPEDVSDSDIKIYQYDAAGRLITTVMPEVNDPENSGQPANPVYDYYYDDYGNLIGILDAKDKLTVFKYNEFGQQTSKHQPFKLSEPNRATLDVYYELSQQSPQPKAATQDYDVLGRLTKSTDYKGQVTGFTYNDRGFLESEKYYSNESEYPDNPVEVIQYTYDNLGRKTEVIVDSEVEQEFYYDTESRIEQIDTPQGIIGYSYSPVTGRKVFVCTPEDCNDSEIEYIYDILGRLAEVIVHKRNSQSASDVTAYFYNPAGSIEQIIYPNGNISEYGYDSFNRLKEITNWKDENRVEAEKLSRFTYTHYADGQRASVTEADGTVISWTYDNLNRLTVENYDAPGTIDDYYENYEYDLCGNRKCIKNLLEQIIVEYSYNELDQLEFEYYTTGQDYTYQYDDNGSLIIKYYGGSGDPCDQYSYNLRGRLSSFTPDGGDTVAYEYNTDGVLVEKQVGSSEPVSYIIDPSNPTGYPHTFKQKQAGQSDIVYILGNDAIGQAEGTSSPVFYIYDGHGSVRNLADSSGSLIEDYHFNGYGRLLSRSDIPSTDYLYAGQMYDWDMDFYNNWHRWYNPYTGRFNRRDEYAGSPKDPISLHKYLYCHANPINGIDPTGQFGDFSLTGMVQSMAIQSIVMKISSPFIKPVESIFAQGLIKGLLPANILQQLKNFPSSFSAFMFGGSVSGVAAKGLAVGFGGGLEVLISPFTGKAGLYGYSEWIIGATRAGSGAMGVAKAGLIFNAERLGNYEGNFRSLTFPCRALPSNIRKAIIDRFTMTPWEMMKLPKMGSFRASLKSFYNKAKILPKMIDGSTQINVFYTPGASGAWGVSISKLYLPGSAGLVAFGMQNYSLLLGNPDAKFR